MLNGQAGCHGKVSKQSTIGPHPTASPAGPPAQARFVVAALQRWTGEVLSSLNAGAAWADPLCKRSLFCSGGPGARSEQSTTKILFLLHYSVEVGKERIVSSAPDVLTACFS